MAPTTSYTTSELRVFHFPEHGDDAAWTDLREACRLTDWATHRLKDGLSAHVRTILYEPLYVCKDYRNIYSNFYSKKFVPRSTMCGRLHFFTAPELTVEQVAKGDERAKDAYVGFSVVQPIAQSLGRTVIDPLKCGNDPSCFYCLQTSFRTHIQGAEYAVHGYPYMAQSGEATVCAHAALWGLCRYLSERYAIYGELYPYDLIRMTGDTEGRRVPYRGMLYTDYSTILSEFGCYPVIRRPRTYPRSNDWVDDKDTFLDIYAYVESGFPVLASFRGHVATLIGHTARKTLHGDMKADKHGFYDSYGLLDQYIVVDDNFFPYQRLGDWNDGIERNYGRHFETKLDPYPSKQTIYSAVIPLPEKAFLEPASARAIATSFFDKVRPWVREAVEHSGQDVGEPLVTRLFLTTSNAFKRRKKLCFEGEPGKPGDVASQLPLRLDLPHFVWIMEISPLPLYKSGSAIGEVALDASASSTERGFIYGRVGQQVVFDGTKLKKLDSAAYSFKQYTHNLGER
jgi:hypothetical protein